MITQLLYSEIHGREWIKLCKMKCCDKLLDNRGCTVFSISTILHLSFTGCNMS